MACDFRLGQRVVCITDYRLNTSPMFYGLAFPSHGSVYTIRAFVADGDNVGLHLVEVINPVDPLLTSRGEVVIGEPAFLSSGFRPLDERRLDQFRAHLTSAPHQPELVL